MPRLRFRIRLRTILFIVVPLAAVSMATWSRYRTMEKRAAALNAEAWIAEIRFRNFRRDDVEAMLWHEFWGGDGMADAKSITLADEYNDESDYLQQVPNVSEVTIFDHERNHKHPFSLIRKCCPQVRRLGVYDWNGSEAEYEALSSIGNLVSLTLNDVDLLDSQLLRMVKSSPNLTYLAVVDSDKLTDKAFETIDQLGKLKTLSIENVAIGKIGAAKIAGLSELRELELVETQITTASLAELLQGEGRFSKLQKLNLNYCHLSEDHFRAIALLPFLQTLELLGCEFSDQSIALLADSKTLEKIDLRGSTITDAGLPAFAKMASLQTFQLSGTRTTQAAVSRFRNYSKYRNPDAIVLASGDICVYATKTGQLESMLPMWPKVISQSGVTATTFGYQFDYVSGCILGQIEDAAARSWISYPDTWSLRAISRNGKRLLMEDSQGFKIWEPSSRAVVFEDAETKAGTFTFVGNDLLVGSHYTGKGSVWNIKTGAETPFADEGRTTDFVLSPDHKTLASYSAYTKTLAVRPRPDLVTTATKKTPIRRIQNVSSFAFKPDGGLIVCRSALGKHSLMNDDGSSQTRISCHFNEAIVSPDGAQLLTWHKGASQLRIYDTDSGNLMLELTNGGRVETVRFTPDGKHLVVQSENISQ